MENLCKGLDTQSPRLSLGAARKRILAGVLTVCTGLALHAQPMKDGSPYDAEAEAARAAQVAAEQAEAAQAAAEQAAAAQAASDAKTQARQRFIDAAKEYRDDVTVSTAESHEEEVTPGEFWVTADEMAAFDAAIADAEASTDDAMFGTLSAAAITFNNVKKTDGSNHYNGQYPGPLPPRVPVVTMDFDADADGWALSDGFNDGRWRTEGDIAWEDALGSGKLRLNLDFDGVPSDGKAYDGISLVKPLDAHPLTDNTYLSFDLYYPKSSQGKLMRFELWSTTTGGASETGAGGARTQAYVRPESGGLPYLNGVVAGTQDDEVFYIKTILMKTPVGAGQTWEDLRLDLHGESNAAWAGGVLYLDNVQILQQDEDVAPLPTVVNDEAGVDVASIKAKYGKLFLIGSTVAALSDFMTTHFNAVTPSNSLKADSVHPNPPQWLVDATDFPFIGSEEGVAATPEYFRPADGVIAQDADFAGAEASGFASHGHVLAWYNQGAPWMTQIIPNSVPATAYDPSGLYYATGNGAKGPFTPVDKALARRAYYNHVLHEMRHFMTTDPRYTDGRLDNESSADDGGTDKLIPFRSFDVLNEEIHETRHLDIIAADPTAWKTALRNTSWLMAMTDDDHADIRQHFVYLLFKFAHIAVPNARMTQQYKANYASLPDYMRLDNNDDGAAGIDAFVNAHPPLLYYNDYSLNSATKAQVTYNMVKELNTAWQSDPLYDGRPLIEGIGIQGHDTVSPTLASENQAVLALFSTLVDEGLLTTIAISELDLVQPDTAPGGAANSNASAPANVLNQTQADAIAYQYALLWKVYEKYSVYLDRVTFWGSNDPGWGGSYKPFDAATMAAPAYYAVMDPDRFIKGHSYLDSYFAGEYAAVK
ncbi:MAG: endo-1,4-beta-xylanase [Treponema sp.]|jgi:GH35 family endo-1,4-beta-xylanase|nr:endo-1,4-beta-xylanase [Treponema sp.]